MGIKYYYSVPQQIRVGRFLADGNGKLIYMFSDSKLIKNVPRVTICTILEGNKLSVGFTTCSWKDRFNRKKGQLVSKKRAQHRPYKVVEIADMKDIHIISDEIINEIYEKESKRIFNLSV